MFRGTRVPVHVIAELVAQGAKPAELIESYSRLTTEMIRLTPVYTAAYPLRGPKRKLPWHDEQPVYLDRRKLATTVMYRHSKENWVPDFMKGRPDVSMETIEKYPHNQSRSARDALVRLDRRHSVVGSKRLPISRGTRIEQLQG